MNTMIKRILLMGLIGLGAGAAGIANASMCVGTGNGGQAIFGEVITSPSCEGMFAGNIPQDGSPNFGFNDWVIIDVNNATGETYDGALVLANGTTSGTWSIANVNNLFSSFDTFVIGLKPDGGFGFFLVSGTSGTWSTSHDLSHAILYAREGGGPPVLPEPNVLALLGLGVFGMVVIRLRRRIG